MLPVRLALIFLVGLVLALGTTPAALAQQGRQRRVFTNEDIATPAPPPPAAATAPAEKAAATAESAPAAPGAGAPAAAEQPGGAAPPSALGPAQFFQGILRRFMGEFSAKFDAEADPARQERWRNMINLTMALMTHNQLYISELESEAKAAAPPPESPPSPPPSPQ